MARLRRIVSPALFVLGVGLVLAGFIRALGLSVFGILASVTAVAALLYAGGLWFSSGRSSRLTSSRPVPLIVFDRAGRIVSGPGAGQSVASLFPEHLRPEIERRSSAVLAGRSDRFSCAYGGRTIVLEALPVRSADGTVVYAMLVAADPASAHVVQS